MKQLKKIGAVGGVVVLLACWPLAVGQIAQKVVTDGISQLNTHGIATDLLEYQRGYLSSSAVTRYRVTDPLLLEQLQLDGLPTTMTVEHQIEHGIFGIDALSQSVERDHLPLILASHTQLNGNTQFSLDIEPLNFQDQGGAVSVSRATVTGFATVLGEVNFAFSFPSVQIKFASGESFSFTELTGAGDGKITDGFWLGDLQLALKRVTSLDKGRQVLLDGRDLSYRISSSSGESGELLQSNHRVSGTMLSSVQGTITDFGVDFTISDIDAASFQQLMAIYQRKDELSNEQLMQSAVHVDTLFSKGFSMSMNQFKLSAGRGYLDAKWQLVMPEGTHNVSQDMSKIIPALTGSVDTFISEELVTQSPAINEGIDELVIMEMAQPVENGYRIDAVVEKGNIVFSSGQKLPIITFLFALMAR